MEKKIYKMPIAATIELGEEVMSFIDGGSGETGPSGGGKGDNNEPDGAKGMNLDDWED